MFGNTSVLLKYFKVYVCTIKTVEGAQQPHGNLHEDLWFCLWMFLVTSELFAYLPVASIRPSYIMVLFASSEGATSSCSDWHWEWTLEVIVFSLSLQAESLKAGCPGPGRSLVSPKLGIIIEGVSKFTKVALKANKKSCTKLNTFYLQGITWVIVVNHYEFLPLENLKGFFPPSVNQVEVNTTS